FTIGVYVLEFHITGAQVAGNSAVVNGIGINLGLIPENTVVLIQEECANGLTGRLLPFRRARGLIPKHDLAFRIAAVQGNAIAKVALLVIIAYLVFPALILHFTKVHRRKFVDDTAAAGNGPSPGDKYLGPFIIEVFEFKVQLVVQESG